MGVGSVYIGLVQLSYVFIAVGIVFYVFQSIIYSGFFEFVGFQFMVVVIYQILNFVTSVVVILAALTGII